MATRSIIGIHNLDNTVEAIYCHLDGSPDTRLPILTTAYNTTEKVRQLLALGGLASIGRNLPKFGADFDAPEPDTCNPYSARGDSMPATKHSALIHYYWDCKGNDSCEYIYTWRESENCWYWCANNDSRRKSILSTEANN